MHGREVIDEVTPDMIDRRITEYSSLKRMGLGMTITFGVLCAALTAITANEASHLGKEKESIAALENENPAIALTTSIERRLTEQYGQEKARHSYITKYTLNPGSLTEKERPTFNERKAQELSLIHAKNSPGYLLYDTAKDTLKEHQKSLANYLLLTITSGILSLTGLGLRMSTKKSIRDLELIAKTAKELS
jgi:hypothetical protein